MRNKADRQAFLEKVRFEFGGIREITRTQVLEVCSKYGLDRPNWLLNDTTIRVGRGIYELPQMAGSVSPAVKKFVKPVAPKATKAVKPVTVSEPEVESASTVAMSAPSVISNTETSFVPERMKGYVPFGNFNDLRSIIKSKKFYPAYITGLSGNGKTIMVEQICAAEKRELIRVNITIETDEDDLIGGFRLLNGETVWQDGPVVTAMNRGAVLLLDEVDLGSNKMMCLQPVLEGKAIFLKKIGRVVHPENGFTVVATANTKGKGSDDGRFIGTNVMNEAFLERFSITMEQEYPSNKVESKILTNVLSASGVEAKDFVQKLVKWAEVIRQTFKEGGTTDIISTRRLVHICEAYSIFNENKTKAIELCLNRFDSDTKKSFLDLYKKVDETVDQENNPVAAEVSKDDEVAF
jgi:midasin (ATPase involved in ribosome maturation)